MYLHVPFCRSICTYCAFAKQEYAAEAAERYLDGVECELELRARETWGRPTVDTLFLGGGTPTALDVSQWKRLGASLQAYLRFHPGAEFTSEANPESLTRHPERLKAMTDIGVNRVSLGVQSGRTKDLELLGRRHGREEVEAAVALVRGSSVGSLSLDLMYGLPGQSEEDWRETLAWALDLGPDHVSAYCLGLEPGTPLAQDVGSGEVAPAVDSLSRKQYDALCEAMDGHGLEQYEISNWAKPAHACRHNLKYWRREDFLACGPSAHGLLKNHRWANPAPLESWIRAYGDGEPPRLKAVARKDAAFEWIFLHLRLNEGFAVDDYCKLWEEDFFSRHGATVDRLQDQGLLRLRDGRLQLTPSARFLSDGVFAEFAPE